MCMALRANRNDLITLVLCLLVGDLALKCKFTCGQVLCDLIVSLPVRFSELNGFRQ